MQALGSRRSANSSLRWAQRALFVAGDGAWLVAWSAALGAWIGSPAETPVLALPTVVAVTLAALVLTRFAVGRPANRTSRLAVGAIGLLVALAIGDGVLGATPWAGNWGTTWGGAAATNLGWRALAAVGLTIIAWWRGIVAGRATLSVEVVEGGFRGAVLALVALFLVGVVSGSSNLISTAALIWPAMVVLFAGLLGMPLARILEVATSTGRQEGGTPLRVSRQWLLLLLGTIGALLVVAVLLASVLTFERLDRILGPLASGLEFVLGLVVYAIALPIGYVLEWLIYFFRGLIHPTDRPQPPQKLGQNPLEALGKTAGPGNGQPDLLVQLITLAIVVCLAAIILWILSRAVFRMGESANDGDVEETRDFVWSWSEIRSAIARWLEARRRRRASMATARSAESSAQPLGNRPLSPRELYRELLRIGARAGRRRTADETANEYQRVLAELPVISARSPHVETLTRVYVQDRYAEAPPDESEIVEARAALERLREIDGTVRRSASDP